MFKKLPHTYVLVFSIIILSAILTWIIPGGRYDRQTVVVNGVERSVIVSGSYKPAESQPQTWHVFSAFYEGFNNMSHIVVFILIIGGAFWIMNESKAIDIGMIAFLMSTQKFEKYKLIRRLGVNNIIMVLVMVIFSIFGAVFGMSEETLAFIAIFVPLAIKMGYDSLVGVCLCYFAAHVGFAGAILNPFTIGIAQGLASVPLFSGIEYRTVCWMILTTISIVFVLWYARRVKKNPQKSIMYAEDEYWRKNQSDNPEAIKYYTPWSAWIVAGLILIVLVVYSAIYPISPMKLGLSTVTWPVLPVLTIAYFITSLLALRKSVHFFIINLLAFTILFLIVGVLGFEWYLEEIAALFLALGIATGFTLGYSTTTLTKSFISGVKDIVSASLVVGFAGGIIAILNNGQIIDTILNSLSAGLENTGKFSAVSVMYLFVSALNLIITSGSAKAALTIPIMTDFSDIIGLSRQAMITAFQFGTGFTEMIAPTSGVLIGVLGIARVPFAKWFKFIFLFLVFIAIIGWLLLIPTVTMKLNGF
ncbi:MAG: YfcC family protein [Bacteroidetes bacterium]|nr:YfcC family protein [Bacteroidota bacterium]